MTGDRTPRNCPVVGNAAWQVLLEELRERGYVPERNLIIECRYTEGQDERALPLASELVSLNVDILLVYSTVNVQAAKQATTTIPIVMYGVIEPVSRGLIASLNRPGGNVTGVVDIAGDEIGGKYPQLLKEAVPTVTRVAVLAYAPRSETLRQPAQDDPLSRSLRMKFQRYSVSESGELDAAFASDSQSGARGVDRRTVSLDVCQRAPNRGLRSKSQASRNVSREGVRRSRGTGPRNQFRAPVRPA